MLSDDERFPNFLHSVTLAEAVEVIKNLSGCRAPGMDKIHTEMLKGMDIVGCHVEHVCSMLHRGLEKLLQRSRSGREITFLSLLEKGLLQGVGKETLTD